MISNEDQAAVDTRIDTIVEHRSTAALVRSFFDPNGPFAAASFDLVGLEGVDPDVIGVADLLAVTFMDVTIRPLAARRILGSDADRLTGLLRDVPGEGDLWDAGEAARAARQAADTE